MEPIEPLVHPPADWYVILEKPHPNLMEAVIQRLVEAFSLSRESSQQVTAVGPILLLEGLSKETAQALRDYFRVPGFKVIATNRRKIKTKCYRVRWKDRPSLAFLRKTPLPAPPPRESVKKESPNQPSKEWVHHLKDEFKARLESANFSVPNRKGARGPEFGYPEWLILFIAFLSVKLEAKNYLAIHKMTAEHWETIAEGLNLKPISERQLRDRLKKIGHTPKQPAPFISQLFSDNAP